MTTVTISEIVDDLRAADEITRRFEKRYGLSSADFYQPFSQGILDDGEHSDDFALWAGYHEIKQDREKICSVFSMNRPQQARTKTMNGSMRRQQGFTIIEVLIAITLLAVGILAAGSMQISALGGNNLAIRVTEASILAGDRMEALMAQAYGDIEDNNNNGIGGLNCTDGLPPNCTADGSEARDGFNIYWNVVDNFPLPDAKTIRVIVVRSDKGVLKTMSVDFIKMRN